MKRGDNMLEKRTAKKMYRKMILEMEEYRRIVQHSEEEEEEEYFDRGFIILPKKKRNIKISAHISILAHQDGFNFEMHDVQHIMDGSEKIMIKIDNESEDYKEKRRREIEAYIDSILEEQPEDQSSNIVNMEDYIKRTRK